MKIHVSAYLTFPVHSHDNWDNTTITQGLDAPQEARHGKWTDGETAAYGLG